MLDLHKHYKKYGKDSTDGLLALLRKEIPGGKFKRGKEGIAYQHEFLKNLIKERRCKEGSDTMNYLGIFLKRFVVNKP